MKPSKQKLKRLVKEEIRDMLHEELDIETILKKMGLKAPGAPTPIASGTQAPPGQQRTIVGGDPIKIAKSRIEVLQREYDRLHKEASAAAVSGREPPRELVLKVENLRQQLVFWENQLKKFESQGAVDKQPPVAPKQAVAAPEATPETPMPRRFLGMSTRYLLRRNWMWDGQAGDFYKVKNGRRCRRYWKQVGELPECQDLESEECTNSPAQQKAERQSRGGCNSAGAQSLKAHYAKYKKRRRKRSRRKKDKFTPPISGRKLERYRRLAQQGKLSKDKWSALQRGEKFRSVKSPEIGGRTDLREENKQKSDNLLTESEIKRFSKLAGNKKSSE